MNDKKLAYELFEEWSTTFPLRDKKINAVEDNFFELFESFSRFGIKREVASEYLDKAINVHLPKRATSKWVYNKSPHLKKIKSEAEFYEEWIISIKDKAKLAFYTVYPLAAVLPTLKQMDKSILSESEQAINNSNRMSKRDKFLQRQYAESFPLVDMKEVEKIHQAILENSSDDVDHFSDILKDLR